MLNYIKAERTSPAEFDQALVWTTLILMLLGIVMVYSASIATAEASRFTGYRPTYFLVRQALFLGVGLIAALTAFQVPVSTWQSVSPWLFVCGILALVLVLIPGVGREVNGARRWLSLGVANLQPSEFMKLAAVFYAADYTARKSALMHSFKKGLLPLLAVMLLAGWLLLREPDFGAFVVIASVAMAILFLGGMNGKWFAGLFVLSLVGFLALILSSPYRMQRIFGFMDPWSDPYGRGYQLSHALIAFGRGEWLGVGLGASVEKLFYLPEAHTDFLLAVIAEELGLVGVLDRDCAVCLDRAARLRHRPPGGGIGALLRGAGGAGHRDLARRADADQHGREYGPAADQGADPAADELRRQRHPRQLRGAGGAVRIDYENRALMRGSRMRRSS